MNLANKITISRIIFIPLFVIGFYIYRLDSILPGIIFIIASSTDFLDGYIARSRNMVTTFGKFLDPLVDKMLTQSAFILLASFGHMEAWIVIVIISREFIINGLRTIAASENVTIAASKWGKLKTVSQMLAITLLLFSKTILEGVNPFIFEIMIYISLILTVISGIDYLIKNIRVLDLGDI